MTLHWWLNMGPVAVVENVINQKRYKTNVCLTCFVKKGAPAASTNGTPKTKRLQTILKNEYF